MVCECSTRQEGLPSNRRNEDWTLASKYMASKIQNFTIQSALVYNFREIYTVYTVFTVYTVYPPQTATNLPVPAHESSGQTLCGMNDPLFMALRPRLVQHFFITVQASHLVQSSPTSSPGLRVKAKRLFERLHIQYTVDPRPVLSCPVHDMS